MSYLIKKVIGQILKDSLWLILISAILAALAWFFAGLVLRLDIPSFLELTRNIYIGCWVLSFGYHILAFLFAVVYCGAASKRLEVPFADVVEGVFVHKLTKEKPISDWDRQWFTSALSAQRGINLIAKSLADQLFKRD